MRTARETGFLVLSVFFGALPVLFSFIRAFQTGTDFRGVWMLGAAIAGAMLTSVLGPKGDGANAQRSAITMFIVCTLVAGAVGGFTGASGAGLWIVAASFGFCIAASVTLFALSRRHPV